MAGSPVTIMKKRATTVRPQGDEIHSFLQPVAEGVSADLEVEDGNHDGKALASGSEKKVEELQERYDNNHTGGDAIQEDDEEDTHTHVPSNEVHVSECQRPHDKGQVRH